jgi:hypothetical protein
LMWALVKYAWPAHLEDEDDHQTEKSKTEK